MSEKEFLEKYGNEKVEFSNMYKFRATFENKELKGEEEFKYPIYALSNVNGIIVKFSNLTSAIVVNGNNIHKIGDSSDLWMKHTKTEYWQILPVSSQTGLYHGQPVWAWNKDMGINRNLRFYDSIKHCIFDNDGVSRSIDYDFYEPYEGEWHTRMVEAFKKLDL